MEEVRSLLGELMEKHGTNEVIVEVSQYLDRLIVKEQIIKLEEVLNMNNMERMITIE